MATPTKRQMQERYEQETRISSLVDAGATFEQIVSRLGVTRRSLASKLYRMGIKLTGDKRLLAGDRPKECDEVALDDGQYMDAVRRLNVAPPDSVKIVVRRARPLPPRQSLGSAGCAAALCAELGSKTKAA